jgi:hypothetical protein
MQTEYPAKVIWQHLESLGHSEKEVRAKLPEWWHDVCTITSFGYQGFALRVANILGIEYASIPWPDRSVFKIDNAN